MSVLKLRGSRLCQCCRSWWRLANAVEGTGSAGLQTNPISYLHFTRSNSVFTKQLYPSTYFYSSLSSDSHVKSWSPTLAATHERYRGALTYAAAGLNSDTFYRTYSTSPQPKQKEDPANTPGESEEQLTTKASSELHKNEQASASGQVGTADQEDAEPKGIVARFKDAYKNYGKVLVGVHCATSVVWFGTFYYAASTGIDVVPLLKWMGLSDRLISPFQSGLGDVAVAYLMYKLATPARYTVTILGTRETVKYLRRKGLMEPVAEGARIRDFVKESRENVREKYEDLKDDVIEKREEYKEKMEEKRDEIKEKIEGQKDAFKDRLKNKD